MMKLMKDKKYFCLGGSLGDFRGLWLEVLEILINKYLVVSVFGVFVVYLIWMKVRFLL